MVERALFVAQELREVNQQRKEPQNVSRSKFFRVHCICRLREVGLMVSEDAAWVSQLQSLLHASQVALIDDEATAIDGCLGTLVEQLQRLQQEVLDLDRQKMEHLKMLNPCDVVGATAVAGKKLVNVQIQTLGGAAFQVTCSLDESPLQLKHYICSSGGPLVRDQKLVWTRRELAWIHRLEASRADSFSLFYLGIMDGDSATLYYARHCYQCEGPCSCVECHGMGRTTGCVTCGLVKPPCSCCLQACRCPNCHGDPAGHDLLICKVCGERAGCFD